MHTQGNTFELSKIEPSYFLKRNEQRSGFLSHHNKEILDMVFPFRHHLIFILIYYPFALFSWTFNNVCNLLIWDCSLDYKNRIMK